jgi:hypothetical protein
LKQKSIRTIATATIILALILALFTIDLVSNRSKFEPNVFVGVDIAYGDEEAVYNVTEAIDGYANLVILGSLQLTTNTTKLTSVCDYLYQKDFHFIVFVAFAKGGILPPRGPDQSFFQMAQQRWGSKFLGAYIFDEPGGIQMDSNAPERPVARADNYSDAAIHYVLGVEPYLNLYKGTVYYDTPNLKIFTSDYALHWFTYLIGYDVVLGQFVGDNNRQIAIAQTRGAATSLGKQWGTMITYTASELGIPNVPSANQLYDDMTLAWQNGAKYIAVFNSPLNATGTQYGILTNEHLEAMKHFWNDIKDKAQPQNNVENAYVLPRDYGYGFRGPSDTVWGLWPADDLAPQAWNKAFNLINTYGRNLDIVHETRIADVTTSLPYNTLTFWNGTIVQK